MRRSPVSAMSHDLYLAAREAMSKAYAPYSKFPVGAAIRTEDGRVFAGANIEVKVPDCTSNPYLAVAALLAVGSSGLERATELPEPLTVVPAKASEAELRAARAQGFPPSLSEALRRLDGLW